MRNFHETVERREHHVDYLGAVTADQRHDPGHPRRAGGRPGLGVELPEEHRHVGAGAALLGAFVLVARPAAEPTLPPWVFVGAGSRRPARSPSGSGVILIGLTTDVPTYLQGALGTRRGRRFALAALTIGWPISAALSGRLFYMRFGFRPTALIGLGLTVLGTGSLALLAHRPSAARGRGDMLRRRPRRASSRGHADRRPSQRRVARARRGHGGEHVRPIHRQRGGCRGARRGRERSHRGVRTRRDRPGRRDRRRCGGVPRRPCGRRPHRRGRAAHAEAWTRQWARNRRNPPRSSR